MNSFYPTKPAEWVALVSALLPLFTWAVSSAAQSIVAWRRRDAESWLRLNELAKNLYNKDGEAGHWRQMLAARELSAMRFKKREAIFLAKQASNYFMMLKPTEQATTEQLKALIRELDRVG